MARRTHGMYLTIANDLRALIQAGELEAGDPLPAIMDLRESYGVARGTVVEGLRVLVDEGVVVSLGSPQGYRVRRAPQRVLLKPQAELHAPGENRIKGQEKFQIDVLETSRSPMQDIHVSIVPAPEEVRTIFNASTDDVFVARRATKFINDSPTYSTVSYYPLKMVQGSPILHPENIPQGVSSVLEEKGIYQYTCVWELTWRAPDSDETKMLEIPPSIPVANMQLVSFDENKNPVRATISILPGDRVKINFTGEWGK